MGKNHESNEWTSKLGNTKGKTNSPRRRRTVAMAAALACTMTLIIFTTRVTVSPQCVHHPFHSNGQAHQRPRSQSRVFNFKEEGKKEGRKKPPQKPKD